MEAADVVVVEVRIRVLALECSRREFRLADLVLQRPGGEGRVLVVVEHRAVIARAAALGGDTNVGDTGVFRAEVVRQNVDFTDRFKRRLAGRVVAEDSAVGALPIE